MKFSYKHQSPNIILITTHDTGIQIGCYNPQFQTPHLNQMAKSGILFTNYFCSAPQCSPSRGSILTGKMPSSNGLIGLTNRGWDLPNHNLTMPQYFRQQGYSTHLIGVQHVHQDARQIGYDTISPRSETPFLARKMTKYFLRFLKLVERGKINQPFYVDLGFFETHRPFLSGFLKRHNLPEIRPPPYLVDDAGTRKEIKQFHAMLTEVDNAIGIIMQELNNSVIGKNTLMIYTTDHGWAFPRAKGTLYDPGLQTSLIFYKPNEIEKGKVITDLISNVDLFPTLAEYVDKPLPPTISSTIQGRSFLSLLGLKQFSLDLEDRLNQGKATGTQGKLRDAVFSELTFHDQGYNPMRSIRTSQWKYIRNFTDCNGTLFQIPIDFINAPSGKTYIIHHNEYFTPRPPEELYDLNQDPNETKNLASNPDYSKILTEMREKLISFLVSIKDPILLGPIVERQKKSRFFY